MVSRKRRISCLGGLPALVVIMLFAASCENQNYLILVGNWNFKGLSYTATMTQSNGNQVTAITASDSSKVIISFNSLPISPGTYQIVSPKDSSPGNKLSVQMSLIAGAYNYASTGHSSNTATVALSTFGKLSISINSAEMINTSNVGDSASVSYLFVNQQ